VLEAVGRADYDAAVYAQLSKLGITDSAVVQVVTDLRADRPPLDTAATAPLELVPGVSHRNRRGFLTLKVHGEEVGQWELADARHHALACLEVQTAVDLDAGYRAALVGIIGLDDAHARNVVAGLAEHLA
jgi:hypothetical protein